MLYGENSSSILRKGLYRFFPYKPNGYLFFYNTEILINPLENTTNLEIWKKKTFNLFLPFHSKLLIKCLHIADTNTFW